MNEKNVEEQTSEEQTSEENQGAETQEQSSEENSTDFEKIKKERDSAIKQKEHYRKKFDEAKQAFTEEKQEAETNQEKTDVEDKMDFLMSNMGSDYSKEDIELIAKKAKIDDISMNKAAEDEDIQTIIETRHQKKQQEEESIAPSSPSTPQPDKPISEMTRKEFQDYEAKVNQAEKNKGV